MLKYYVLFLLLIFSPLSSYSQAILTQIDSMLSANKNDLSFCHELISISPEKDFTEYDHYGINLAQSIGYFILFENYEERSYKIQILEKGIDRLKLSVSQSPEIETRKTLKEMYNDLFNQYYLYKSGNELNGQIITTTIRKYFKQINNDEIINWFNKKYWSNKCSEN